MRFRPAISKLYLFFFVMVLAGVVISLVIIEGWRGAIGEQAVFDLVVTAVLAFPMALFFHFAFPAQISASGVSSYSVWGFKRSIAWDQVGMVRLWTLGNLRWARLYSSADGRVTYLALFVANADMFRSELHRVAPVGCPIFKYVG